jgi:hypothetical protein
MLTREGARTQGTKVSRSSTLSPIISLIKVSYWGITTIPGITALTYRLEDNPIILALRGESPRSIRQ